MKKLTLTFLLAFICRVGFAQNKAIDSLKHELSIAKHDTSRVLIMANLCADYRTSKPDSAIFFGKKGLALAEKINFPKGIIRNTTYYGRVFRDLGNLPKALAMQFKAIQIAKDNNLLGETGIPLNFIAGNYGDLKEYSKTLMYQKQAISIYETYPSSPERLPSTLMNIGVIFFKLNQIDSANNYAQQAYNLSIKRKIAVNALIFGLFANIQTKLGNNQLAIDYFHKGLALSQKDNNLRTNATLSYDFAKFFQKTNQLDSCIYYAKKGLEAAQLISFKQGILNNSNLLAEMYDTKDAKEALRYYKMANATKESLFGAGSIQALQSLIAQEEARQKEIENVKLAYNNQLRQYLLLAGLAILLLIAFFLYRNNQKEKRAKNLLQEKNEEIQLTLSKLKSTQNQLIQKEKLASLGELTAGIAHEIQNPLNFVNNFSELSVGIAQDLEEEIKNSPLTPNGGIIIEDKTYFNELISDLTQNQEKINHHGKRASSIVSGMLEHSRTSTGERVMTDINKLADEYLRLSYHGMRAKNSSFNADYEFIADENLPLINVVPQDMGRVLLNLINNAFWAVNVGEAQSLTDVKSPKVIVKTEHTVNQLTIKVIDNGIGIPKELQEKIFQPFFTTKPTGEGTGLGLSLSYDIVTQGHGGTIEVESVEGEGTTFVVKLPL